MPILGLFELRTRQGFSRNAWRERPHEDDLLAEASWGLRWILKMQDPATGMFFEDVGGGVPRGPSQALNGGRRTTLAAARATLNNRWTDNRHSSGDERRARVQYNPIAQYVNTVILLDAAAHFHPHYPAFSTLSREAALKNWAFMKGRKRDAFHRWTSVLSWRLLAALRLHAVGIVPESEVAAIVSVLLDLQSPDGGFWFMDLDREEPYRGILHAAQPGIALAEFVESDYENPLAAQARTARAALGAIRPGPMLATNPFGMMPYGLFYAPGNPEATRSTTGRAAPRQACATGSSCPRRSRAESCTVLPRTGRAGRTPLEPRRGTRAGRIPAGPVSSTSRGYWAITRWEPAQSQAWDAATSCRTAGSRDRPRAGSATAFAGTRRTRCSPTWTEP